MRKKIVVLLCVGTMALALAGCGDKKDESKNKETQVSFQAKESTEEDTEELTEEITEDDVWDLSEIDSDWTSVGSERTGYLEVPSHWQVHESTQGDMYAIQVMSESEGGLISLIDNSYGYEIGQYDGVDDPADIIIQAFIEQYEEQGAIHLSRDEVIMDGETFYLTVEYIPAGGLTDYDYYIYTYVTFTGNKFYTVCLEGKDQTINTPIAKAEATFSFRGTGTSGGSNFGAGSGEGTWYDYEVVMDGDTYVLSCDFSEFEDNGWRISSEYVGDTVDPDDFSSICIERNGQEAWIVVGNVYDIDTISVEDAQVIGIIIDYELDGTKSYIAGGVTLGMTYDEVVALLGEPTSVYDDSDEDYQFALLTYEGEDYSYDFISKVEIQISDGFVNEIDIRHW